MKISNFNYTLHGLQVCFGWLVSWLEVGLVGYLFVSCLAVVGCLVIWLVLFVVWLIIYWLVSWLFVLFVCYLFVWFV